MLEQEMASIIRFVLEKSGKPSPYYWNVPQNFMVPAVYFPPPEIDTGGETFLTYNMDFAWYIKFFHNTMQGAYTLGSAVVTAIRAARNLIPLIAEDGSVIEGSWVRVNDPRLIPLDDGAAQLAISWRSRRPYDDGAEPPQTSVFHIQLNSGPTLSDEEAAALEKYAISTD